MSEPAPGSRELARAFFDEAAQSLADSLEKIKHCLDQLDDQQVWWRPDPGQNSIANLLLHLAGNVRQWIIAGVGGDPDLRNRPQEFAERRPLAKAELYAGLEQTVSHARRVLHETGPEQLLAPRRVQSFCTHVLGAIFHSVAHFSGHTQEIVSMTRTQLGDSYQFHWRPVTPEQGAP